VRVLAAVVLALGSLPGCEDDPRSEAAAEQPSLEPKASPSAWVRVTEPEDLALVEIPAHVVGDPGSRAAVAPVFEGQVVRVHVRPGDTIEAGDPIADLSTPEVTRAAAVLSATNHQLALQRERLAELERLRDQGLIGSREVFAIQARIAELESERAAADAILATAGVRGRNRIRDDVLRLQSPTTGTVTEVDATPGQIRGPAEGPLAVIVAEGSARIEASMAGTFPASASVAFVTREGREVPLRSEPIATAVDPANGMTRVWLAPEDERVTLMHGVRGSLRVEATPGGVADASPLLQVPSGALRLDSGGQAVVLARRGGGSPRDVPVSVQSQSGSAALVRSPELRIGDEVAADPASVLGEHDGGGGHAH
jgi:membrane fusion protein, heavy metal efflux system